MKFLGVFFISLLMVLAISIKLFIVNQETKIKRFINEIIEIDIAIEKNKTDISYSTRPQNLEKINNNEFNLFPIEQSDIIKLDIK
tara:strand:+ start:350 stop:604 length:255 start_codon:yes stop_codon:yes gene_type:complete